MKDVSSPELLSQIPNIIDFSQTVFSISNILIFVTVVLVISSLFYWLGKKSSPTHINLSEYVMNADEKTTTKAEKLDNSKILAVLFGVLIIVAFSFRYFEDIKALKITPNLINFLMLGLGIILHGSFKRFINC